MGNPKQMYLVRHEESGQMYTIMAFSPRGAVEQYMLKMTAPKPRPKPRCKCECRKVCAETTPPPVCRCDSRCSCRRKNPAAPSRTSRSNPRAVPQKGDHVSVKIRGQGDWLDTFKITR